VALDPAAVLAAGPLLDRVLGEVVGTQIADRRQLALGLLRPRGVLAVPRAGLPVSGDLARLIGRQFASGAKRGLAGKRPLPRPILYFRM